MNGEGRLDGAAADGPALRPDGATHPTGGPTLEEVRAEMGIPSAGDLRGQKDTVGFAVTREQMAEVWRVSTDLPAPEGFEALPAPEGLGQPPAPEGLGPTPAPGGVESSPAPRDFGAAPASAAVVGAIVPHDDYIYAGRVYRAVIPVVQARTAVVVGVFHKYRRFGVRNVLVFDPYRAWRTPDGTLPVSALREEWRGRLRDSEAVVDARCHDSEHSIEAIAYWLHHTRGGREIVPLLAPAGPFESIAGLAERSGAALADALRARGLALGLDVAIVISADAVHYGADFGHMPFGEGGEEAYARAVERDRAILRERMAGPITRDRVRALYETFVDPNEPDTYRLTWCGRFSIPFGMLLLDAVARALGQPAVHAAPIAYATSAGWPELPLRSIGLGVTAPADLRHFVGHAAVAFRAKPLEAESR